MATSSMPWLKPAVFTGALVPFFAILLRAARHELGANPIQEGLNRVGLLALTFIWLTLACTPMKLLFGWTWPAKIRRMLGLFAFFYACVHLLTYAGLDQRLALGKILKDVVKRPFILVGFTAWLCLIPLAVTSTKKMVQRLGFRTWKLLHRLVYLIGVLAAVHFYMRVKKDVTEPLWYAAALGVLLGARVVDALRKRRGRPATSIGA